MSKETIIIEKTQEIFLGETNENNDEVKVLFGDTKGVPKFEWSKIYEDEELEKTTVFQIPSSGKIDGLIQKTIAVNSQSLFYSDAPNVRSLKFQDFKSFDQKQLSKFVYGQISSLKIRPLPQIATDTRMPNATFEKVYAKFVSAETIEKYENPKSNWGKIALDINTLLVSEFQNIRKFSNFSENIKKETGNWKLHIAWPFVEGCTLDSNIRTPLMYIPISVVQKQGEIKFSRNEDQLVINAQLIKKIYAEQKMAPTNLNLHFNSIEEIFQEYLNHGIKFENQLDLEFENFDPKDSDKIAKNKFNSFNLVNTFLFENKITNENVYNDLISIQNDEGKINFPEGNKKLFHEEHKLEFKDLPLDVDRSKNEAIQMSLDSSTVIWGPPGTGKSEAIAGILIQSSSENKNNLVVTEKNTALDVLIERIETNYALSNFMLKLNGNGLSKFEFYDKIKKIEEKLKITKDIGEVKFLDKFQTVLSTYKQMLLLIADLEITEEEFWQCVTILSLIKKQNTTYGKDSSPSLESTLNDIKNKYSDYVEKSTDYSNLVKLKLEKLEILKGLKIHEQKLKQDIYDRIFEPICYLIKTEVNLKFVYSNRNNPRKIFKYLSNKHYKKSGFNDVFHKHFPSIKMFINTVIKYNDYPFAIKRATLRKSIEQLGNKIQTTLSDRKKKMKSVSLDWREMKLTISILSKTEGIEGRLKGVEDIVTNIWHDDFERLNDIYNDTAKVKKEMYESAKIAFQKTIINNIVTNLKNDKGLLDKYKGLISMVSFPKTKQIKPSILVRNHTKLITTIFPMILSTPDEVARFLPREKMFDYGIFDEASQMHIERSFGSIHRSNHLIIAGDDKQLSPSSLFSVESGIDDSDTSLALNSISLNADSLLTWAKSRYREVLLNTHYRSKSAKLIEYSNIKYYDGKLNFADSPVADPNPIEVNYVNGNWGDGTNVEEGMLAIEDAMKHFALAKGKLKIGIITFNASQMDSITKMAEADSALFDALHNDDNKHKLFVKNIENVQGDEADIVIFSLGYAPNETGKLSVGPLNHISPNRLNVAITRAKLKMIIYKSFTSEQLTWTTRGGGREILSTWVKWLENQTGETSILTHTNTLSSELQWEFHNLLEKSIDTEKYKILANYVINNVELDISIYNIETKTFIGAIELFDLNKMNQQSADDKERKIFLESIGWKLIKVSSMSFWKNKENSIRKIKEIFNIT